MKSRVLSKMADKISNSLKFVTAIFDKSNDSLTDAKKEYIQ